MLLQHSTGLKRPVPLASLAPHCPFTALHVPYSWTIGNHTMRAARWGLSCSRAPLLTRGVSQAFIDSAPNRFWSVSSHGTVVMRRETLERMRALRLFELDVLEPMGAGRMCWETSAGLVGGWLAQVASQGQPAISGSHGGSAHATSRSAHSHADGVAQAFTSSGGFLDAACIHPVAYKMHGNNLESLSALNPKLQRHFKAVAVAAKDATKRAKKREAASFCGLVGESVDASEDTPTSATREGVLAAERVAMHLVMNGSSIRAVHETVRCQSAWTR